MPVSSQPHFRLHGLALVALMVLAACSKESTAPVAPVAAASDSSASDAMAPLPAPVAVQNAPYAAAPRVVNRPAYSNAPDQPSYVNESGTTPAYADDPGYANDDQQQVVSVYVDPPLEQPAPVAVDWAPPPMLVEEISPQPDPDSVWTGGYWAWQGRWVWSAGRWSRPPRPDYRWQEPYYEHRADKVVYVPAYWSPPERHFIAPAVGIAIVASIIAVGVHEGHHADGPQGVFIPPPPGSRPGIIVPAPIGTPPRVVVGAPPVINVGMRVNGNVENNSHNVTNNVTNITNVRNVTIIAPPTATANGRGFQQSVAADPHRPPAIPPGARATAPQPRSATPVVAWQPGHPAPTLPAAQPVRGVPQHAEVPGRPGQAPANDPRAQQHAQQQAQQQKSQQDQARAQQQAQAQKAQQEQAEHAQLEQAQRAQQQAQQKAQQDQVRAQQQAQAQKAQQEQAQHAQQEQAQRVQQQVQQQKAQQDQARAQQQAQAQKAQQEQAQHAQLEQAQRAQQQAQQKAQQDQARAEQQRSQQEQAAKAGAGKAQAEQAQADKAKADAEAQAHRPPQHKPDDNERK
jgi:hypothetical protein